MIDATLIRYSDSGAVGMENYLIDCSGGILSNSIIHTSTIHHCVCVGSSQVCMVHDKEVASKPKPAPVAVSIVKVGPATVSPFSHFSHFRLGTFSKCLPACLPACLPCSCCASVAVALFSSFPIPHRTLSTFSSQNITSSEGARTACEAIDAAPCDEKQLKHWGEGFNFR